MQDQQNTNVFVAQNKLERLYMEITFCQSNVCGQGYGGDVWSLARKYLV
jgi:hypothetical protein